MTRAAAFAVVFGLLFASSTRADERIIDFRSDIVVAADASMTVRETIRVRAEGWEIKRGIYRDFPTRYRDSYGNFVKVGFEILETLRDGAPESHHTKRMENGVRIYLGKEYVSLTAFREYTYTITYRVTRELGFFAGHDELYWNVTGNGWTFPIEHASAHVTLPSGIRREDIRVEGYTGRQGSRARDLDARVTGDGMAEFAATRPLGPAEGLTIVVGFPKGFVEVPTRVDRVFWFLADNRHVSAGVVGVLVVLGYYLVVWFRFGRDPARGPIVTRYEPPDGLSPAAVRYLVREGYDLKTFASAIVGLAVKKLLTIEEAGGRYTLRDTKAPSSGVLPDEQSLHAVLFRGDRTFELSPAHGYSVRIAGGNLEMTIENAVENVHFVRNSRWVLPGAILSALAVAATVLVSEDRGFAAWLTAAVALVLLVAVNVVFHRLLRAPTVAGRRMFDQIEGLKTFLSAVESDRLERLPIERTPEVFERLLPYAMALDLENTWSRQFAGVLAAAGSDRAPYAPEWYSGTATGMLAGETFGSPEFATALESSMSGAIAESLKISSSSTAPGSTSGSSDDSSWSSSSDSSSSDSSGGGGGGSSGGGGGGGGGGGW